jgi:hypothetical protein
MINRVNKVIVGKQVDRTGSLTLGSDGVASTLVEGEVVVLDKNKELLVTGSTISDSDIIYIGVGTDETWDNPNGDERREIYYSLPIEGAKVRTFLGTSYVAPTEEIATVSAGLTPVVGTEYTFTIVYTDMENETEMAQFREQYRYVATSITLETLYDSFRTSIAANSNSRVTGSGAGTMILTSQVISFTLNGIDDYKQVRFEVFLDSGNWGTSAVSYNTPVKGNGSWKQVRDLMKKAKAYDGITNYTHFPVPTGMTDWMTLDSTTPKTYDYINIEHDNSYQSPDLAYMKDAKLSTLIALPIAAGQTTNLLGVLNPWMASTPKAFANISV